MRITVAMMLEPEKHGLKQCPHCNGYGSSLKESARTCTQCGGSGLIRAAELLMTRWRKPKPPPGATSIMKSIQRAVTA